MRKRPLWLKITTSIVGSPARFGGSSRREGQTVQTGNSGLSFQRDPGVPETPLFASSVRPISKIGLIIPAEVTDMRFRRHILGAGEPCARRIQPRGEAGYVVGKMR